MATEIVKLGGIDLFYVCVFSFSHVFEVSLYVTLEAYIQSGDSSPEMQTECDLAGGSVLLCRERNERERGREERETEFLIHACSQNVTHYQCREVRLCHVNTLLPRQHAFALMCQTLSEPGCHLCGSPCLCLSNLVSLQHVQISTCEHTTVSIVIRHIGAPILWHSVPTGSYGEVSLATVAAATVPITAFRSQMQMRGQRQYRTPFTRT